MGELLERRRASSKERLERLRTELSQASARLHDKACVYVTGSFGRGEASEHSDLDLFIVGRATQKETGTISALSRLNQICVKADLVHATRQLKFEEFSGDGEYLEHYTVQQLVKSLGKPDDDASNTFTARLLLLLESRPLLEETVYKEAIESVIAAYWRDYEDHKDEFLPAYLANDILRLWRTFCVNYEARTSTDPVEKKAKRKLKNYKLKHSRLLTCYSALAYLSAEFALRGTVTPDAALDMVALTPTGRLEQLARVPGLATVGGQIQKILDRYEGFLHQTDASEDDLVARLLDSEHRKAFGSANDLGDLVYELLSGISLVGNGRVFHRLLLV
jgi:predicted nucleotidyltransferase